MFNCFTFAGDYVDPADGGGLSGGAIAGIVIGVIVLIFAITVLVLDHFEVINIPWPWKKKQKPQR